MLVPTGECCDVEGDDKTGASRSYYSATACGQSAGVWVGSWWMLVGKGTTSVMGGSGWVGVGAGVEVLTSKEA
jgi:hypothetical protein